MSKTSHRTYLAKRIASAKQVVRGFPITRAQMAAHVRATLARFDLAALPPIPPMKRRLQVDILAEKRRR